MGEIVLKLANILKNALGGKIDESEPLTTQQSDNNLQRRNHISLSEVPTDRLLRNR